MTDYGTKKISKATDVLKLSLAELHFIFKILSFLEFSTNFQRLKSLSKSQLLKSFSRSYLLKIEII